MNKIENNPYRVCGLLAGASLKDVNRAKRNLKLASIGKTINSDLDFNFFNSINRTGDALKEAFSEIDQSQGKLKHAFFWFSKGNSFDETAINYLQNGDKQKALEIWEKVTTNRVINSKNISSLNNIGTLKLLNDNSRILKEGIEAKFKLIESDSFEDFVHIVADETYTIDRNNEIQRLITYLLKELKNRFSDREVFNFFTGCSDTVQSFLSKKFTQEPLHNIEGRIERTKSKRKSDKGNAYKYGLKLYQDCKDDLALLKSILGINDLKYKMTADSLAKEILQCGVDYFQKWKDVKDPSKEGLTLFKYARSTVVGKQTKDRIEQNIEGIEEWAKNAPIQKDLEFITQKLARFQNLSDTTDNAKDLIVSCKPKLQNIKKILGSKNDYYLQISSAVVNNAQGMLVATINRIMESLNRFNSSQFDRDTILAVIQGIIKDALEVSTLLGTFDMVREVKVRYDDNHKTLKKLASQIGVSSPPPPSSGGGCYIATMAYGDYNHPQVMELRKFRDEVLNKSYVGQLFIKIYYKYSPRLVEVLKNQEQINKLIKTILNQIIKAIKK